MEWDKRTLNEASENTQNQAYFSSDREANFKQIFLLAPRGPFLKERSKEKKLQRKEKEKKVIKKTPTC